MPAKPASNSLRCSARAAAMLSLVWSPRVGASAFGGRGSRFASIQARAWSAELVDVDRRVAHVVPSSEPGQLAQVLAVPGGVAEAARRRS